MPTPVLYLAPWVDIGGSDTSTIDWFRWLDRERFRASLITTQPSPNRRLQEIAPYAEELWELPVLLPGDAAARFILAFIHTRRIRVVHIMNARLGFELLPDIASLPEPPRVVVQFHGEEPGGAGYVRYVTTRYGNLVDAFSLATKAVYASLDAYDVPAYKRRFIPIGVDAEREFSPDVARPGEERQGADFHVLYPARLTAQKNPLLMVEVAARLREAALRFQIHVVGDGELTEPLRERIAQHGLGPEVVLHGADDEMAKWYARCHAVLLTSAFETGPPRTAYEAMAMGLPIVAPDLPQLREILTASTGCLVGERDVADAYADALCALARDPAQRAALGRAARARVRREFTADRMAAEHAQLYDELEPTPDGTDDGRTPPPADPAPRAQFGDRPPGAEPLVSVLITCFNQGRYLRDCIASVAAQTYESIETILVDDCSTDPETIAALSDLEQQGLNVLRLATNRGPSAARNAAVDLAAGDYLLPLDADDLLVDTAVAELVDQLNRAGERIGFIYPNIQFFGNRTEYWRAPAYNLHALLSANLCPASSLIDRRVFEQGLRYPEDIVLGHEDWDFALTLAEHGIHGEAARGKTLLCRKHGFSRSDLVDLAGGFEEIVAARHPKLFARRAAIKAEWNPALTLIALGPVPAPGSRAEPAAQQTCSDFEVIVSDADTYLPGPLQERLCEMPGTAAPSRAQALTNALRVTRGRYVLATYASPTLLLEDRTFIEKLLRAFDADPRPSALALADAGRDEPPFRVLDRETVRGAAPTALCWRSTGSLAPPPSLLLPADRPLETIARWLGAHAAVEWRHFAFPEDPRPVVADGRAVPLGAPPSGLPVEEHFRQAPPLLPDGPPNFPRRLAATRFWTPSQTRLLCRHRHRERGTYIYANDIEPPNGHELDTVLGCAREFPGVGTTALVLRDDARVFGLGGTTTPLDSNLLGFLEQQPLPLLDALISGHDPETGQTVLAAGEDDQLAPRLTARKLLGFIEPYPIRPRGSEPRSVDYGLTGLLRSVDLEARRHRYAAGRVPPGQPAGELGALFTQPTGDCEPLRIADDGHVFPTTPFVNGRPALRAALSWTGAPLTWRSFSRMRPKVRATARRALDSARVLASPPTPDSRTPTVGGYLLRGPTSNTLPLYASIHPVTGDQLLSTDAAEGRALGYRDAGLLGYLIARAPVTGRLGPVRPGAPWAARFGLVEVGQVIGPGQSSATRDPHAG